MAAGPAGGVSRYRCLDAACSFGLHARELGHRLPFRHLPHDECREVLGRAGICLGGKLLEAVPHLRRFQPRLHADLGREPTAVEMSDALGMSLEQYRQLREEASPVSMLSLTDETADDP